ncbi:MAG: TonB-dependent receptor, partial [Bacteroidales bacterium]|nr:TonB-dependent receptor [Bacteroidales bacterium]
MKHIKILSTIVIFALSILTNYNSFSQEVHGVVYEANKDGSKSTLPGVNIYWAGTTVGTATDVDGNFHLKFTDNNEPILVISYIGYQNDTMLVDKEFEHLDIVLAMNHTLNEVVIVERIAGSHISRTNPIMSQIITSGELQKAACCNLSESFETNASVDVAYSDAVSGAKQIKLLGLDGKYSQIQTENIPNLRGLGTSFGLGYVPGSWMESIQVSKGTASVKNGYESITGQINIEYKK